MKVKIGIDIPSSNHSPAKNLRSAVHASRRSYHRKGNLSNSLVFAVDYNLNIDSEVDQHVTGLAALGELDRYPQLLPAGNSSLDRHRGPAPTFYRGGLWIPR